MVAASLQETYNQVMMLIIYNRDLPFADTGKQIETENFFDFSNHKPSSLWIDHVVSNLKFVYQEGSTIKPLVHHRI